MCDSVVVVGRDRVLFAKSSDRDPNEGQGLEWHPRRDHGPHARVRCTWIEIPQARRTYATLISRPFWMWGAEIGTNEHGVTIGNEAVFTDQPYRSVGLTGMDLVRLALERAASADEAACVIEDLVATHGQGGGGGHEDRRFTYHSSFVVADPLGALVLETAGQLVAVERVRSGARSISNGLTIDGFAQRHGNRLLERIGACRARRAITEARGGHSRTVADLAETLRDHGRSASPRYSLLRGGLHAPCVHAGGLLASSQTTASWVAELRPDRVRHWVTATAAPCTGVFKPVDPLRALDLGPFPTDRADGSLFFRHERVHRAAMRCPDRALQWLARTRADLEHRSFDAALSPEEAFAESYTWLAAAAERAGDWQREPDVRPAFVRLYWRKRDRRAGLA